MVPIRAADAPTWDLTGFQSSLSPISSVPFGDSVGRLSSSSSVASDDSDGDVGLLTSLLSLPSFGSMPRVPVSSDFSFYSAVGSPTRLWDPCSMVAFSLGGPISVRTSSLGCPGFRPGVCFSQYYPQIFGFHLTVREAWAAVTPPRFLEWIGAPESTRLLDKGPSAWLHSLSREHAIEAARQLHRDVCLLTSNLNILDQYVMCLQGAAATILEFSLGARAFPSAAVAVEAPVPWVRRTSVHMEAMGLWRPSLDPVGWT